uniref:Uncharacterized protein n=1 Tax=Arundo donax TaxID=35708 RepID=A0A0A9H5P5_ARUDO
MKASPNQQAKASHACSHAFLLKHYLRNLLQLESEWRLIFGYFSHCICMDVT